MKLQSWTVVNVFFSFVVSDLFYRITKHKNYKLLEDYDKKNLFDIESYMKRKGKAKLNRETVITRVQ